MAGPPPVVPTRLKLAAAIMVLIPAIGALALLTILVGSQPVSNDILAIFLASLLLGMAGASVFVVVQLFAEGQGFIEKITRPRGPISGPMMVAAFMLSGGLVAAASQASVGSFVPGNIWTTFLIGFGWQGAVSGIEGSTATRAKRAEVDIETIKENAAEVTRIKDDARKAELERRAALERRLGQAGQ